MLNGVRQYIVFLLLSILDVLQSIPNGDNLGFFGNLLSIFGNWEHFCELLLRFGQDHELVFLGVEPLLRLLVLACGHMHLVAVSLNLGSVWLVQAF